jgi:hypothetical protein
MFNKKAVALIIASASFLFSDVKAQPSPFVKQYEVPLAFTYGLGTRWLAKKIGAFVLAKINSIDQSSTCRIYATDDACKTDNSELRNFIFGLAGLNVAIALWTAAHDMAKGYLGYQIADTNTPFGIAHQGGMDTLHLIETFGDVKVALDKIYSKPSEATNTTLTSENGDSEALPLLASFGAGLVTWGSAFKISELLSQITPDPMSKTMIILTLGIAGSIAGQKLIFAVAEKYWGAIKNCHACNEVFQVGGDLAYILTGVGPQYMKVYQLGTSKEKRD